MPETLQFSCPYCGSPNSSFVDISQGTFQEWIIDCEICCRPIIINIELSGERIENYSARKENE